MKGNVKPKILIISLTVLFLLFVPIAHLAGVDWMALKQRYPLFPLILTGTFLSIVGVIQIAFRKDFGKSNAEFKKRLASKHPAWKRLSGKSDEELEHYFSEEYNKKLTVIGAIILIIVGIALTVVGFAV